MIIHIPHSHPIIPGQYKHQYFLNERELEVQHRQLNDWYVHELFEHNKANVIDFPFSRFFVDVERFDNDVNEPMAAKGMGRFYLKTIEGKPLRQLSMEDRQLMDYLYRSHHERLRLSVESRLRSMGEALIIDAHSFHSWPLKCDLNQDRDRPDICLGYDELHFHEDRLEDVMNYFRCCGYSVGVNYPYESSIIPTAYYGKNFRVQSLMIEVNRKLYMHEFTLEKKAHFKLLKGRIRHVMDRLYNNKKVCSSIS